MESGRERRLVIQYYTDDIFPQSEDLHCVINNSQFIFYLHHHHQNIACKVLGFPDMFRFHNSLEIF